MEEVEIGKKKEEEEASFRLFLSGSVSRLFFATACCKDRGLETHSVVVVVIAKQLSNNIVGGKCHKILFLIKNRKRDQIQNRKVFLRPLVGLFFLRRAKNRWLRSRGTLIIIPQNGASPTSRPFANNNKRKNNRSSRNTRGVGGLHNGGRGTDDSVFILFFRGKRW